MSNAENRAKLKETLKKTHKMSKIIGISSKDFRYSPITRISSGELGLDIALGGGYPLGRMIKIAGKYSYGKTIILANAMRQFTTKFKKNILMIDPDGTTTGEWLEAQGVDTNFVDYNCPETMEESLDLVEAAIMSNSYDAVFLDSLAALTPKTELEGSISDFTQGLKARKMNQFFRKMRGRYSDFIMKGADDIPTFFYTNHVFTDLNKKFDKNTTPGGEEQDNAATIIINLFRSENIWNGPEATKEEDRDYVGWKVRAKINKNKVSPPFKSTVFGILNEPYCGHPSYSFYHADTVARFAVKIGVIEKGGAWFEVKGFGKFQGEEKLHTAIVETEGMGDALVEAIKSYLPDVPIQYEFPTFQSNGAEKDALEEVAEVVEQSESPAKKAPSKKGRKKK